MKCRKSKSMRVAGVAWTLLLCVSAVETGRGQDEPAAAMSPSSAAPSLANIVTAMESAQARLTTGELGADTRAQQNRIVSMLGKLIDQAEQQEDSAGNNPDNDSDDQPDQPQELPSPDESRMNGQSRSMLPESPWGHLRDKRRDPILNALRSRFPARYEQLVEQYYRSFQSPSER